MTADDKKCQAERPLTPREQRVLAALISARTVEAAAEEAGVSARTVYRMLSEREDFRAAYRRELGGIMQAVGGRLQSSALRSLAVLEEIRDDATARHADRMAAAGKILDLAFRAHEVGDLVERLELLEADAASQRKQTGEPA